MGQTACCIPRASTPGLACSVSTRGEAWVHPPRCPLGLKLGTPHGSTTQGAALTGFLKWWQLSGPRSDVKAV